MRLEEHNRLVTAVGRYIREYCPDVPKEKRPAAIAVNMILGDVKQTLDKLKELDKTKKVIEMIKKR